MAVSNLAMYINGGDGSTTGWYAVTAWATGTSKTVGQIVRQNATPAVNSERCFVCIVAGTTHATTEPTWTTTVGAKTTDNTVTWQECSGVPALNGDATNTPASSTYRSTPVSLGQIIKNNAGDHYHICTTAGSCGSGEPTYSTTTGGTTTDSTVTWTCLGAVSSFTTIWAAPARRLQIACTLNTANGTAWYGFVSASHTETYSGATTISGLSSSAPPTFLCVANSPSAIPPASGDVTTGASVSSTSGTLTLNFAIHYWGFTFGSVSITVGSSQSNAFRLTNCTLNLTTSILTIGGNFTRVEFVNTTANWSGAGTYIALGGGWFRWRDTPSALSYASTMSTSLFNPSGLTVLECIGVDFSAWTGTNAAVIEGAPGARATFIGCKFASTVLQAGTGSSSPYAVSVDYINCDSGGAIYAHQHGTPQGYQKTDATIYRSGGASDGTTAISWKILTNSTPTFDYPFECLPAGFWNATTGSTVTLTVEGLYAGAAAPTTSQVWLEAEYFGTSSSTRLSRATTAAANALASGSAGTASTATWTNNATARANIHSYVLGDTISVSSNPSLVFVCIAQGSSAGSLPGAYATATEGTAVTDNTCTFRACVRFKMAVACSSPQSAGFVRAIVKVAAASTTVYIDPYITVS